MLAVIILRHDAEQLAHDLIVERESDDTRPLCLADFADALRRCDTPAERAVVAVATIRTYTRPVKGTDRHA